MSISEADRHQLIRLLSEAITPKGAALLMEHLPPVGWADVATKRDLDVLAALTKRDLDAHAAAELREQGRAELARPSSRCVVVRVPSVVSMRWRWPSRVRRCGRDDRRARRCAFEATDAKIDASKYEVLATLRQDMLLQTRTFVLANVARHLHRRRAGLRGRQARLRRRTTWSMGAP